MDTYKAALLPLARILWEDFERIEPEANVAWLEPTHLVVEDRSCIETTCTAHDVRNETGVKKKKSPILHLEVIHDFPRDRPVLSHASVGHQIVFHLWALP